MIDFEYVNPARIIFGEKPFERVAEQFKQYQVSSLLFVYSGEYVKSHGIFHEIEEICKNLGIKFVSNGDVVPNPKVELVRELVQLGRENHTDFILAVGGGSAVDTAKAVAIGIKYDGDVWDFFTGKADAKAALPIGVITTIPASGSETSNASIISNGLSKLGYETELIIPKFAVMNPRYTMTLPAYHTACGISDILSHLFERYWTNTEHVDTTDYLIEGAVRAVMLNGERLVKDPNNYDARAEIQWLASIAHNNLLNTGRQDDWASHRVEHEISAQYGITHGEGMAVVGVYGTIIGSSIEADNGPNPEPRTIPISGSKGIRFFKYSAALPQYSLSNFISSAFSLSFSFLLKKLPLQQWFQYKELRS